jgi:methyltransferase (TIGR00027 family)
MKTGQESQTAVLTCMGRAAAHGRTKVAAFSDPTALQLLPDEARARVERFRAGEVQPGLRGVVEQKLLAGLCQLMVPRTVAIDESLHGAACPQVVILGAGLDGRAWRMPELRDAKVFEVDHPDSQRAKRERVAALAPVSRDVRFVPVDFERDRLDDALAAAGHDPSRPTAWVWEGVVMYLTKPDVEATLGVIEQRSAAGSSLVVAYRSPAFLLQVASLVVAWSGEPHRSTYKVEEMRALLAQFGFGVTRDEDLPSVALRLSAEPGGKALQHMRIASAVRIGK